MHEYEVPLTEAEEQLADPLVKWDRGMPRPEPKRKRDTPQFSTAYVDAALENHKTLILDVMAEVVGTIQQRFNDKLKRLENEITSLRTALEVERQVNLRMGMAQEQQRHYPRANGHA
jgi:hypothetical protein